MSRSSSFSHHSASSLRPSTPAPRPATSYGAGPVQDTGILRKPIDFFNSIARTVTKSMSRTPTPEEDGVEILQTPSAVYQEVAEELRFGYQGQSPAEEGEFQQKIAESSEGEILVYKGSSSGRLFVVKHTRLPNEAMMHKMYLMPHPNIITAYETLVDRGQPGRFMIWMEKCAGDLFNQLEYWSIRKRSIVPETFLLHFVVESMQALAYLHHGLRHAQNGVFTRDAHHNAIIHGDIKPDNFFLRWRHREVPIGGLPDIVLGDFGTAKLAEDNMSKVGPGTLAFHAPEDVAISGFAVPGPENVGLYRKVVNQRTIAADMYSLGQIIWMMAAKERNPMPIGTHPSHIRISGEYDTPDLLDLIRKCMVIDPSQRAEASFHPVKGILPLVNKIRAARLARINTRFPLDSMEWESPPARRQRRF